MALLTSSTLVETSFNTHLHFNPPIKNRFSQPKKLGFSSNPLSPQLHLSHIKCTSGYGDYREEQGHVVYPRPSEIQWKKELANSVNLIGIVGAPVEVKYLNSGKILAWTRLGVKKSASETFWVNLTFWNELANVAFQHIEKGQQIYVSGRLVADTVEGEDEKRQTYYKVVVSQINFIEKSFSPSTLYESEGNFASSGSKFGNLGGSIEELWQAFFANPVDWWDNRKNKKNPKYPDFKHKHTGEALWVEGKYNPSWVKSQLAILDSRMEMLRANEATMASSFISGDDARPF
ncbi:hypothetical protein AMTRI_Chr03g147790 [Amborella trichopoda]|uniref:Single-stranded DNA-binding protein n=1 Tax=Amborella trichopoda TaxID=13333 RepID=W1P0H8_AMBTC|nr:protein OSB1, mitochondrial [Amborella trichopoda]ERN01443.1 hypothetical protein AMTR_s00002p00267110 [Amborella trichopoda]|eukprot:XP_006838874.1 protein OSB1, mitochondrial [Amborella trichopoda]